MKALTLISLLLSKHVERNHSCNEKKLVVLKEAYLGTVLGVERPKKNLIESPGVHSMYRKTEITER